MTPFSDQPLRKNKAFLIAVGLTVMLFAFFWLTSRYPDLDQKALMAGDTQFSAIGFDLLMTMPPDPTLVQEIGINSVNWMYTNWKGMTFGVLAGALLLTILPHLQRRQFNSRTANSALGMLIGAPLGVCVNCAMPVAQGTMSGGSRPETSLAMLVSSPTMNVVVITMVLSLFPLHMALTKIGLTLVFILIVIPLIVRAFPVPERPLAVDRALPKARMSARIQLPIPGEPPRSGWITSVLFVLREATRNLVYLFVLTVPLMILAGVLGAMVITLLPFDVLGSLLPGHGRVMVIGAMLLLVLFALTLPSPMTFDVIVAAVLLGAGLSPGYVMVMLFGLGIFSIYPFMLLWRQMSRQIALAMVGSLAVLGVTGGVFVQVYHPRYLAAQNAEIENRMAQVTAAIERDHFVRPEAAQDPNALVAALQGNSRTAETVFSEAHLLIERDTFAPASIGAQRQFTRVDGAEIGLTEGNGQSFERFLQPMTQIRAVASGDIHNDGWPDLVFGSLRGFAIYANTQDGRFERQDVPLPQVANWTIGAVALMDLTNDGWLDLVFTTLNEGVWMIENSGGVLDAATLTRLANTAQAVMPTVLAFDDTNRDGFLDIFVGNTSYGDTRRIVTSPSSQDVLLMGTDTGFELVDLTGVVAETLTALFIDLNDDGWRDLVVGNDFEPGDIIYLNDGQGVMTPMSDPTQILPSGGTTTMSITSADIDNDLIPEIFLGQKAWQRNSIANTPFAEVCAEIINADAQLDCVRHYEALDIRFATLRRGDLENCAHWPFPGEELDCIAVQAFLTLDRSNLAVEDCDLFTPGWPDLFMACQFFAEPIASVTDVQISSQLPSVLRRNLLFAQDGSGPRVEIAEQLGLGSGGWVWNARFADLDQDSFQDLFIVTGVALSNLRHPTYYFRNLGGSRFEERSADVGLDSLLDIASYTYVDIDLDGDLDIVVPPLIGEVFMLRNDSPSGNALSISLRDERGNRFAVGSRITLQTPDGGQQMRDVLASGGYMSHDALSAHFGLADQSVADHVVVTWPDGETTEIAIPLEAGSHYTITRQRIAE